MVTRSDQVIQQKRRSGGVRDSAVALALTLFIAGCAGQGMGTKETIGTGSGAARGGIAGGLLGGRGGGGVAGALVGATVGGLIGNRIGAALDEDDRSALAAQSQQALVASADNAAVPWKSGRTDTVATITPINTHTEARTVAVVRDANVAPAPALEPIGRTYQAKGAANIKLAPSITSASAGRLAPGDKITAVGKVSGEPWIMVARGGRTIGYVSAASLEPVPRPAAVAAAPARSPSAFDLDSDAPVRSAADLDALGPNTKVDKVTAEVPCRDLKTTVTAKGQSETSTQSACKSPDGSWELL